MRVSERKLYAEALAHRVVRHFGGIVVEKRLLNSRCGRLASKQNPDGEIHLCIARRSRAAPGDGR